MAQRSGLSANEEIALTDERYPKYNAPGAEVAASRPFQKLLDQCVIGACHMTPTVYQSSASTARPRLLELSRQVTVDFQPDADFDERRGCPGHGILPFLGQYPSRWSAYPGGVQIQEIKIIAFVYGPGSGFHPDPSARPTGIVLPHQHADPRDDPTGPREDPRVSSLLWPGKSFCETSPSRRFLRSAGRRPSRSVFSNAAIRGVPAQKGHALCPFSPRPLPDFGPVFQEHCFHEAIPRLSRSELTLRSIGVFNIGPAIQARERTIL
jgi:hypothetical protein